MLPEAIVHPFCPAAVLHVCIGEREYAHVADALTNLPDVGIIPTDRLQRLAGRYDSEKAGMIVKGVAAVFTEEERNALSVHMGVVLRDDVDYSEDDLDSLHDAILEKFPYEYDGVTGEPKRLGILFEQIIDKFQDKLIPDFFR